MTFCDSIVSWSIFFHSFNNLIIGLIANQLYILKECTVFLHIVFVKFNQHNHRCCAASINSSSTKYYTEFFFSLLCRSFAMEAYLKTYISYGYRSIKDLLPPTYMPILWFHKCETTGLYPKVSKMSTIYCAFILQIVYVHKSFLMHTLNKELLMRRTQHILILPFTHPPQFYHPFANENI